MNYLPKDVARIIYRYVNDLVIKDMQHNVECFDCENDDINNEQHNTLFPKLFETNKILESSICKIHKKHLSSCIHNFIWSLNKPSYLENDLLGHLKIDMTCSRLIICQDVFAKWNNYAKKNHCISIINGCVFRSEFGEYPNDKTLHLIPYFESNYCWQDIAARFLRNRSEKKDELYIFENDFQKHNKNENCVIF